MKLRESFLKAIAEKPLLKVEIEDYGITAYIGKLSAGDRTEIVRRAFTKNEAGDVKESPLEQMCMLLQIALRNEDGSRAFEDNEEDLTIIKQMDGAVVSVLFDQAMEFNSLTVNAVGKALKNSVSSPN